MSQRSNSPNIRSTTPPRGRLDARYFRQVTCFKCGLEGHFAKDCPSSTESNTNKCFLCAGNHKAQHCTQNVCPKCFRKGHSRRDCKTNKESDIDHRFKMMGKQFNEEELTDVVCMNCFETGHVNCAKTRYSRDQNRAGLLNCPRCGSTEHEEMKCKHVFNELAIGVKKRDNRECYRCGELGHIRSECPNFY